jgi:hypothetical protein
MDVTGPALMEGHIPLGTKWQFMRNKPCGVQTPRFFC